MALRAVFSEGRTLCVRIARLHECRGIPFAADGLTMSRWSRGHMPRSSQCLPIRACGARPSAGGQAQDRSPSGESPEMTRKAVFSEGRTPCVRLAWPNVCRGIPFSRDGRAKPGHPRGHARVEPIPFPRACGARPSRRGDRKRGGLAGEGPGMTRKAVFSEGRTLCVRFARLHVDRDISFPPHPLTMAR
jgi:hypothetical protein